MNFLTFKKIYNLGIFLYLINFLHILKKKFKINKFNYYKKRVLFFKKTIKFNNFFYYYSTCLMYIKFGNKLTFLLILFNYNNYIKSIITLNIKKEILKIISFKNISFVLSKIKRNKNHNTFIICCKFYKKIVKNYGIGLNRTIAEENSYKNLLKTILMQ
ncbi:hypothetical protein CUN91_01095 [Candidatus Carsonella ruddii]|uniref:Uncharacterized protein n=1 Tax=Carsonella ruddii TaxID=114186 RepID=A0A2K8K4L6_CARRU|nr:hypothetical protein [Candidatus Carsonella ruddii]ATX33539.1 hypothetical protein CUN91_01095 [Candidatus Carsonella ruddii]